MTHRAIHDLGRTAEMTPSGAAMASATTSEATVSWSVTGIRCASIVVTGSPLRYETPRSPRTTRPSHSAYCTGIGRSSPMIVRARASCSGVTSAPSSAIVGSPGIR